MSSYYTDHPEIEFHLDHLLMERIVKLGERNYQDGEHYDDAPVNYDNAIENYKHILEITGDVTANIIEFSLEDADKEGLHLENGRTEYVSKIPNNIKTTQQAGLWGASIPWCYGRLNLPSVTFSMMPEMIAIADAGFQSTWSLQSRIDTLYELGSDEQCEEYIPRVCKSTTMSMDLAGPDAGSNPQRVVLEASYDEKGDCWRLNGVKCFITNGNSDIHLVLVRSEEGTRDGRGPSMFIYDKRNGGVDVRYIEDKLGIHGSSTCELVYKNAKTELYGSTCTELIKYVITLMNGVRLGTVIRSVDVEQEAYNETLTYAKECQQFGQVIIEFSAVRDMLLRMRVKLDVGRSLLYQTARYVDLCKALEDIRRDRKLSAEECVEMEKYTCLADIFTPLAKGINSEYANENAYDAISIHGGSGSITAYKFQRLFRDARIFSIYEGTTQLRVVVTIRYIMNGTYLSIMREMLDKKVEDTWKPLHDRLEVLTQQYEEVVSMVKKADNQEVQGFLARRLYNMTANPSMSVLLTDDASRLPELFGKNAHVYMRYTKEKNTGHYTFIKNFRVEDLISYRSAEQGAE